MERTRWPALDSVRGVAVVAVVAYHLGYVDGGFLGVDLFFALSGFLITGLLLAEIDRDGRVDLRQFWGRRVRRLLPALIAVVALVGVFAVLLGWPDTGRERLAREGAATLVSLANWEQVSAGVDYWSPGAGPFRHAWSLSIEEQVYLLWPLLVVGAAAIARRTGRKAALVVGATALALTVTSAAWSVWLSHHLEITDLSRVYLGTDTRLLAPMAGAALAALLHGRSLDGRARLAAQALGAVGAVALVVMVATSSVADPALYRNGTLVVAALAATAVVAAGTTVKATDPVTQALGHRSYALYLWSWPAQVLVEQRWPEWSKATTALVVLAVSALGAEASLRLIEQPLRYREGWAAAVTPRRAGWAGLSTAAVAALVAVALTAVPPPPPAEELRDEVATRPAISVPPTTTEAPTTSTADPDPAPTEPAETTTTLPPAPLRVAIIGDSVAWSLGANLPEPLPPNLASVDTRAVTGCGLLAQVDGAAWDVSIEPGSPFIPVPGGDSCQETRAQADDLALQGAPDVVLVGYGGWEQVPYQPAGGGPELTPLTDEATDVVSTRMVTRLAPFVEAGVRIVLVPWMCPGPTATESQRDPRYVRWFADMLQNVADDVPRSAVLQVPDAMCGPDGPSEGAIGARPDGAHWADPWPWSTWLPDAVIASLPG